MPMYVVHHCGSHAGGSQIVKAAGGQRPFDAGRRGPRRPGSVEVAEARRSNDIGAVAVDGRMHDTPAQDNCSAIFWLSFSPLRSGRRATPVRLTWLHTNSSGWNAAYGRRFQPPKIRTRLQLSPKWCSLVRILNNGSASTWQTDEFDPIQPLRSAPSELRSVFLRTNILSLNALLISNVYL